MSPRRRLAAALTFLGLMAPAVADAAWVSAQNGAGFASARAMATPAAPTATVNGRNVTVTWATPASGPPPTSYVVRRYDASTGASQTVLAGCAGSQSGVSCTEAAVPAGSWRYSVAAVRGGWQGSESARSDPVTVSGPALNLSPTTITSLPATLNGGVTGFATGQNLTVRLDDQATGTVLGGTLTSATIPANGTANGTVVVPASVANGSHTIYAVGSGGDVAAQPINVITPTVDSVAIVKTAGGDGGYVKKSGTYYVYADVNGSGSPPAGLASVRADVSSITSGQTAVAMTAGSYTADGATYDYRSAQLTASSTLTEGSKSFSVTATDTGGTAKTRTSTATGDNTAPAASDVQTTNVAGGTARRAELGDSLILTYSEPIDAASVLSGWNGSSTNVVVRLVNAGTDSLQIWNAANTTQLPLGTVSLGRNDYTTANITFGATGTPSTMTRSGSAVTIVLGTPSAAASTAANTGTMSWTPSATATDRAGNAASTTAKNETGAADGDF
jgi:hypothetical protein